VHHNLFATGNTLAARIATDIQFVVSKLQTQSLFYLAVILLAFSVSTNLIARAIANRYDVNRALA
jgi:ABC-type phosphate transport system permease subunit